MSEDHATSDPSTWDPSFDAVTAAPKTTKSAGSERYLRLQRTNPPPVVHLHQSFIDARFMLRARQRAYLRHFRSCSWGGNWVNLPSIAEAAPTMSAASARTAIECVAR